MKIARDADQIGAPQQWATFEVAFGGPGNTYIIGLQFNEWKDLDAWNRVPEILEKAYGADEAAKIQRSGSMAVQSSETRITQLQEDLSYNAGSVDLAPMYTIRRSVVKRDMQDAYANFIVKLNEAWQKAGDGRKVIRRVSALGPSLVYTNATPMEKWEDRDRDGNVWELIAKAHGEIEARRLREDLQNSIVESNVFVIFQRPDLSRMATGSTSN